MATKPNLKTATFKEIADWVYEAPDHKRVAEGLTFTAEKPTEDNRKVDIEVGGFTFWFPSWGQGDKTGIMLYGNPGVNRLPSVVKAMEKMAEVFGIAMEDAKELALPADSIEPLSEEARENIELKAKLEVYQQFTKPITGAARVTFDEQ